MFRSACAGLRPSPVGFNRSGSHDKILAQNLSNDREVHARICRSPKQLQTGGVLRPRPIGCAQEHIRVEQERATARPVQTLGSALVHIAPSSPASQRQACSPIRGTVS